MRKFRQPTGHERFFDENEVIVSKTDLGGRITYANDLFVKVGGYTESELLNQPHSLIRHPDMPRCVFETMWKTLKSGEEIFAYVINMCKNGDHYWVLAQITPSYDKMGNVIGYHSNRRVPDRSAVETVQELYKQLRAEEKKYDDSMEGMQAASNILTNTLAANDLHYDEFIFSLS